MPDYEHSECLDWPARTPSPNRQCTICGAPSSGYHFNAPSCSACAAFFRRTVTLGRQFLCAHQGRCKVHFEMRIICRACRYAKCIRMGMERQAVQPRRDSNAGRRKISYSKRSASMKPRSTERVATTAGSPEFFPDTPSYSSSVSEEHEPISLPIRSFEEMPEG